MSSSDLTMGQDGRTPQISRNYAFREIVVICLYQSFAVNWRVKAERKQLWKRNKLFCYLLKTNKQTEIFCICIQE